MEKRKQNEKGITLVALVITVIVLTILVGVSVSTALNTGLIENTKTSVAQYDRAQKNEVEQLDVIAGYVKDNTFAKAVSVKVTGEDGKERAIHYGDTVKGYIDLDENTSTNDWQIFSVEENNVWITTKDYVQLSEETARKAGMRTNGYKAWWSVAPTKYGYTNPNENCVASLLDNENWTEYVNSKYALKAIGGPTREMLTVAYNAKTGSTGNITALTGTAYYISSSGKTSGYWLASPNVDASGYMMRVDYHSNMYRSDYRDDFFGVRPLVCLKSDVNFEQDKNDSTVWNLLP